MLYIVRNVLFKHKLTFIIILNLTFQIIYVSFIRKILLKTYFYYILYKILKNMELKLKTFFTK